jgi:glycosyltransferase involved in cell wall biosynthesis
MDDHNRPNGAGVEDLGVCVDLTSAALRRGGLGRYQASLAQALLEIGVPLTAFVHDVRSSHLPPPLSGLPTLQFGHSLRAWRLRAAVSYAGAPLDRTFPAIRLFHATDHLLPNLTSARSVFTLHDTAYVHHPEHYLPRNRLYLRTMVPRFLERADRVIVVSEHARAETVGIYGVDPERVDVIPEGVEERFRPDLDPSAVAAVRRRYGLPERSILYVGTIQPRKNLTTLLDAFARVRDRHPDVGLVIAGEKGWLFEPFFDRLRTLRLGPSVVVTGHVPDEDLPALFGAAEVFAYPSLFEGFGLPPLEAMASGIPVVCSEATSLPEVVGDAGILVPPLDVDGWVAALGRLLDDPAERRRLSDRGLERARRFTWAEAALRTLDVYRAVMGRAPAAR